MSGVPRRERYLQIAALRAEGLSFKEIAVELGAKEGSIRNAYSDPDGSKQKERRKRYQGTCTDCGRPTTGSLGRAKAPDKCLYCAQGKEPPARTRLTLPVRLCDLPLDVRLEGVKQANRVERDKLERAEILFAALFPSGNVYYLAESARPLLDQLEHAS